MDRDNEPSNDVTRNRCTPPPDPSEIAEALQHAGSLDGFSLEWAIDRAASRPRAERGQI
ncbi:MAG: hypothetical protein WBB25_03865 [Sulfitobacter sp.]